MPDLRDPTPEELAALEEHGTRWWEQEGHTLKVEDDPEFPDHPKFWLIVDDDAS